MQSSDLDEGRDVRQAGGGGQKSAKTDQADLIPLMYVTLPLFFCFLRLRKIENIWNL
jgi:hypothetical protein